MIITTRMVTPEPHPEVLGGSKFLNNFLPIHPAALSFPLTTTDHDSHHDIYLCICLSHFTSMNNFRFCPWARPGYSRRWPGACTNCSLPTSLLAQRLLFLWWDGSVFVVFFPQKSTIEVLFTWSDSFPPFCPLSGSLENAKNLKVLHVDAESSLDVLGVQPQFHECAYHRRNCPSTSADTK